MARVTVLRLGHRRERDKRISTHVGLVARAFGASEIVYSGEEDARLLESVNSVALEWGGPFKAAYQKEWKRFMKNFQGIKVHLTMYGIPFQEKLPEIRSAGKDVLVVVGGEKVPPEAYHLADYNLAVTSQPHSEVAALAVFLYEYHEHREPVFKSPRKMIVPQERGKKVIEKNG